MTQMTIDGQCFLRMLHGGAAKLAEHTQQLNALNVFPVPDGDTGTNMRKTMEAGLAEAQRKADADIGAISALFANGTLLGARGNSGVILSQIFAGLREGLSDKLTASAHELASAYQKGIAQSYAAVQNPTEGTILTVFRESTEYAAARLDADSTVADFFKLHIDQARRSLAQTKQLLPVLAEADVVDSGGAGYLYIAEGMYEALCGKSVAFSFLDDGVSAQVNVDLFTRDSVLEYGYCTEFLLRLTTAKVDPDSFDIQTVLSDLEQLHGESIVAYKQDDIIKVHVHTFHPGHILTRMQTYGEFLSVKVENMSLGHSTEEKPAKKDGKPFCVVAVAAGEGLAALFRQMGADCLVSGGQTANPSVEEFLEAFGQCDAPEIIVLPNNKNILLAAHQAAKLYEAANVHVVETKSLMQGYSALSVITPGITDIQALLESARRAAETVIDGEITQAVRDAVIDGSRIRCGDYIGISGGRLKAVAATAEEAVLQLAEFADAQLCEIITLVTGVNVTAEQSVSVTEKLQEAYADCQIVVYEGGQAIYDYLLALE